MIPEWSQIIDMLLERGFRYPFRFALVANNDSVLTGSCRLGDDGPVVAVTTEYFVEGGARHPINIMFIDASGDAANIVLAGPGEFLMN